jgi:predicted TPR repeat methyltransferase
LKLLAEANPESFAVQMQLAVKLADSGDTAGAIGLAERAAKLLPFASDDNNPHRFIAGVALKAKDTPRAIRALEDTLKVDHADVESARPARVAGRTAWRCGANRSGVPADRRRRSI